MKKQGPIQESSDLLGIVDIFQQVLNGSLEVEGLDEGRLVKGQCVPNTPDFDALGLHAHAQLRMLPDAPLNDV